jgi:3,4-dihydroxy 2-butanone 4-phosphate synthase/GTP cyclohydrolase II
VLVRVHIEDTLCDVLLAHTPQGHLPVHKAMGRIAQEGRGVAVLLRIPAPPSDIVQQIRSLQLEAARADDAPGERIEDQRTLGIGSQILADVGVGRMRLLSSPKRYHGLGGFGLEIVAYVQD